MTVEFFRVCEVPFDGRNEPHFVELLSSNGIEVGGEDHYGLKHRVAGPQVRSRQGDDFLPLNQVGNNLEGFGDFSAAVFCEYFADFSVNSFDFRVVNGLFVSFFEFFLQKTLPLVFISCSGEAEQTHQIEFGIDGRPILFNLWFSHLNNLIFFVFFKFSSDSRCFFFLALSLNFLSGHSLIDSCYSFHHFIPFCEHSFLRLGLFGFDGHC